MVGDDPDALVLVLVLIADGVGLTAFTGEGVVGEGVLAVDDADVVGVFVVGFEVGAFVVVVGAFVVVVDADAGFAVVVVVVGAFVVVVAGFDTPSQVTKAVLSG